jgi:hypothetical protein
MPRPPACLTSVFIMHVTVNGPVESQSLNAVRVVQLSRFCSCGTLPVRKRVNTASEDSSFSPLVLWVCDLLQDRYHCVLPWEDSTALPQKMSSNVLNSIYSVHAEYIQYIHTRLFQKVENIKNPWSSHLPTNGSNFGQVPASICLSQGAHENKLHATLSRADSTILHSTA